MVTVVIVCDGSQSHEDVIVDGVGGCSNSGDDSSDLY